MPNENTQVNIALLKESDKYIIERLDKIVDQNNKITECIFGNGRDGLKVELTRAVTSVKWLKRSIWGLYSAMIISLGVYFIKFIFGSISP